LTTEQIKELQQAIGTAAWNLNLDRFAEATGQNPEHDYTREKFKTLSALSKNISQFEPETLQKILAAGASKPKDTK